MFFLLFRKPNGVGVWTDLLGLILQALPYRMVNLIVKTQLTRFPIITAGSGKSALQKKKTNSKITF